MLKVLVNDFNILFMKLFATYLKPKLHIAPHHPSIMANIGPLRNCWAMRYEVKHPPFKQYSHVTHNRKNICYSVSLKHQLTLCDYFLGERFFKIDISYTCCSHTNQADCVLIDNLSLQMIKKICIEKETLQCNSITVFGVSDNIPLFSKIEKLYKKEKCDGNQLQHFAAKILELNFEFDDNIQAYTIEEGSRHTFISLDTLPFFRT